MRRRNWAAAALCALVLVAAASAAGADGLTPLPMRVLTLRATGELEVRDSADGHVVRTIATLTPLTGLLSQIAITPDGRTAFVERSTAFRPTRVCPRPHPAAPQYDIELVAVDVASGRITSLGRRRKDPVVSPDGATLVYSRYQHCQLGGRTVARDLVTADERALQLTDSDGRHFRPTAFASSDHVDAFASYDGVVTRFRITQPDRRGRVAGAQVVGPGGDVTGLTCMGSTFVGARRDEAAPPDPGPWPNWRLAAVDLTTGSVAESFGDLPNHSFLHVADVDASCRHALVTLRQNSSEDPRAQSPLVLARWSGGGTPVPLGEDVIAATWMP